MIANDYLEVFTLPLGYYLHTQFFTLLTETALLYLPFLIVVITEVAKSYESGDGTDAAMRVLKAIELRFFSMMFVIMIAVSPLEGLGTTTVQNIDYASQSCNDKFRRAIIGSEVDGLKNSFSFTHDLVSYAPLLQTAVNSISTATVNSVISTIPCSISYRDIENAVANIELEDSRTVSLINEFNNQCYLPALNDIKFDSVTSEEFLDGTYLDTYGVISPPLLERYANNEQPISMTTQTASWPISPHDNVMPNGMTSLQCNVAIGKIGTLIVNDERFSGLFGSVVSLFGGDDEYRNAMEQVSKPEYKYKIENLDNMELAMIHSVFRKALNPLSISSTGAVDTTTTLDKAESLVSEFLAAFGSAIVWLFSIVAANIAMEVTPWTISIFQGVIAAFGIVLLFFTAYSWKSVLVITVYIFTLESLSIAIEIGAWIDNVAMSIVRTKYAQGIDTTTEGFIASMMGAICYIFIPAFVYKWLISNILGGQAVGDLAPGASDASRASAGGLILLNKSLSKGSSFIGNKASELNSNAQNAGKNLDSLG